MSVSPRGKSKNDFDSEVVIYHSRKGAWIFASLVAGIIMASVAMFWYLAHETSDSVPLAMIVVFVLVFICVIHVAIRLLADGGKVALIIGREGVKFDCYHLIRWNDIEEIYIREEDEGADTLWLSVKEGVTFLKNGPPWALWLAKKSGLHQHIDITRYGCLSMKDDDIRDLLEQGLKKFREP